MAKSKTKFDRKYMDKLKEKGMVSDDTYALCMADGGVVPEPGFLERLSQTVDLQKQDPIAFEAQKRLTPDPIDNAIAGVSNFFAERNASKADREAQIQNKTLEMQGIQPASYNPAIATGSQTDPNAGVIPASELAIGAEPYPAPEMPDMMGPINRSNSAFGTAEGALKNEMAVAQQGVQKEDAVLSGLKTQMEKDHAESQIKEKARQDETQNAMLDLQKASQDWEKTSQVDPQRYMNNFWGEKDTGQKVLAGIGLLLGAFGSGGNKSVAVIERAIDRDIESQKANAGNKLTMLGQKRSMLQDMRDKFGDERTAELATKKLYLDKAEIDLKRIAGSYRGAEAQTKAAMGLAEIANKKAEIDSKLQAALYERKALQQMAGGGTDINANALPAELRERYVPGYGLALTKEGATKANESVATINSALNGIKTLTGLADRGSSMSLDDRATAQTTAKMLQGALRTELIGPGAVSESEWKLLNDIVANPTDFSQLSSVAKTRLNTLATKIKDKLNNNLKQYGIQPRKELDLAKRVP